MNPQIETINAMIQRGLLRATIMPDGTLGATPTVEGIKVQNALARKAAVDCTQCGAPYPRKGTLPKYSVCADCRAGKMPVVDFIKRP